MFNSLTFGATLSIILGLSLSTLSFGYLSYSLSNDKAVAVYALKEAQETIAEREKSLNLKYLSCELSDKAGAELILEKSKIDEGISPINTQLKELATVKKTTTPLRVNVKQETIKNESNFLPDDGLLSPNVTGLLRNGWCSVYPDSDQCLPTGQFAGKPL
jgi:hypothetical protein